MINNKVGRKSTHIILPRYNYLMLKDYINLSVCKAELAKRYTHQSEKLEILPRSCGFDTMRKSRTPRTYQKIKVLE